MCGRLRFTGYLDLKSQDLGSLIAGDLLEFGFMEFDIDEYNSVLPTCALQTIIYFCGI